MTRNTRQLISWETDFGKKYTNRNKVTISEVEKLYKNNFGITRTGMNKKFIGLLDRSIRILEVGCNVGNQLQVLQKMGFKNLYGIEPQEHAVELSKKLTKGINITKGNAFDIPFKDNYFGLVFTSGVLIHISPDNIAKAIKEIYRCSNKYIWGFEYYAKKYENITYRGEKGLLWKADFSGIYKIVKPSLKISKLEFFKYKNEDNVDAMFLLKK